MSVLDFLKEQIANSPKIEKKDAISNIESKLLAMNEELKIGKPTPQVADVSHLFQSSNIKTVL